MRKEGAAGKLTTKSAFTRMLDELITDSSLSQREIADAIGYEKPNIITMFKKGDTRLPVEKVPALADALGVDRADMLNQWLAEYAPSIKEVLDANLGMSLSKNERSWIANMRKAFGGSIPPCDERFESTLASLAGKASSKAA